jgi:hypothetical protein
MRVRVQDVYMDAGPAHLDVGDAVFVIHAFVIIGHEMVEGEEVAIGKMFTSASVGYPMSMLLGQLEDDEKKAEILEAVNAE